MEKAVRVSGLDPFPRILPVDEKHKPSPTPSVNTKEIVRDLIYESSWTVRTGGTKQYHGRPNK
jgi:hypothetical protein